MNKTILSLLAAVVIAAGSARASDGKAAEKTYSRSEIDSLIDLPESYQRQEAAESILDTVEFDTTWAFGTIIKGIQIEEAYLERSEDINSRYVWNSWWNIKQYVHDLVLLGSNSPTSLKSFGENLPHDQRTWVLIGRGHQKDETIHDTLRKVITGKGNPVQKAMAVEALSQYKDTSDVSIFVDAALDNENSIEWAGDSDLPGFNPVAEKGVNALREMGYILEWDSKEFKFNLMKVEDMGVNNLKPKRGDQDE